MLTEDSPNPAGKDGTPNGQPDGGVKVPAKTDEEKKGKPLAKKIKTLTPSSDVPPKTKGSKAPETPGKPEGAPRNTVGTRWSIASVQTGEGGRRERAFSATFKTVYPERWKKKETIGTNPISGLSKFHKSRLGLERIQDDSDEDLNGEEGDVAYVGRRLKEMYESLIMLPVISGFLRCRGVCVKNYEDSELELMFQPRTHNGAEFLQQFLNSMKNMPEALWRSGVHENLSDAVENSVFTSNHILKLTRIMNQFRITLDFSDLNSYGQVEEEDKERLRGRSMIGALIYLITFSISQLEKTEERMHSNTMGYIRKMYLELVGEGILLFASTCHIVSTAEIVLEDLESAIGKYLFRVRSPTSQVVNLTAKADFQEQARVRLELRKEKRMRDAEIMQHKIRWPARLPHPPVPELRVVSRTEGSNTQWHPVSLFDFQAQTRIITNLIRRAKNAVADAYVLLTEFDQTLHTHRPSRKSPETETLFEDTIYLKDRLLELNTFPKSILTDKEVDDVHEVGRILSDEMDDLYIAIYAGQDVVRETVHVTQLCHEYLRDREKWNMDQFNLIGMPIQQEYHRAWNHFPGFPGMKTIPTATDSIPLFNASVYPSLIRICPVKVAKLFLSFQTPGELLARREPSSHSLWEAFDTIDNPTYPKHSDPHLNKHERN